MGKCNIVSWNIYIYIFFFRYIYRSIYISSDHDSGRRPKFPEKDPKKDLGGVAGVGIYPTRAFAKMTFFKVDFKCFLSRFLNHDPDLFIDSSGQYEYVAKNRISKLEKLRFFTTLICTKIAPEMVSSASS